MKETLREPRKIQNGTRRIFSSILELSVVHSAWGASAPISRTLHVEGESAPHMKIFLTFLLCALPASLTGQTSLKTFTSTDHAFQFHYPGLLVRCTPESRGQGDSAWWTPADSCEAYSPVCDESDISHPQTVVCFAFPHAELKDVPTFEAAAFTVEQVSGAKTEKECIAGSSAWVMYPPKNPNTLTINRTQFHVFHTADAGMSHYLDGHVYRAFHRNTCYQLSIRIATTNGSVLAQPVENFSAQNEAKVMRQLNQALDSFRFLK